MTEPAGEMPIQPRIPFRSSVYTAETKNSLDHERALGKFRDYLATEVFESQLVAGEEIYTSLSDPEKEVYSALFNPIELESQPFDKNELSPTPGDPYNVMTYSTQYYKAAELLMIGRFTDQSDLITNSDEEELKTIHRGLMAIELEILTQHELQCRHNNESIQRLQASFRRDPASFDPEMVPIILAVRSGEASTEDRIALLLKHPEMESIEDMKSTCPLDIKGYERTIEQYYRTFMELQFNTNFDVAMIPTDERIITIKDVTESASNGIEVVKTVLFEVTDGAIALELVERKSFFIFPTRPQMRGISENIIKLSGKSPVNRQPISVSAYFRIKRYRDDETHDSLPPIFDSTKLHLIKDGRPHDIEDLSD